MFQVLSAGIMLSKQFYGGQAGSSLGADWREGAIPQYQGPVSFWYRIPGHGMNKSPLGGHLCPIELSHLLGDHSELRQRPAKHVGRNEESPIQEKKEKKKRKPPPICFLQQFLFISLSPNLKNRTIWHAGMLTRS